MKKLTLPLIIGVIFGTISVLIGQIPKAIALWSGLELLGNQFGYVLGALVVAYFNTQSWKRAFWTSTLTIVIANFVYYALIEVLGVLGIAQYVVFSLSKIPSILMDFAMWSVIGVVVGALSATAMWFEKYGRTPLLRIGALVVTYFAILWVMCERTVRMWLFGTPVFDNPNTYIIRNLPYEIFVVSFVFVITTVLLVLAVRKARSEK